MKVIKFYAVSYTKSNGAIGIVNVKARNEQEALANAKNNRYTGKDFSIIEEINATKDTVNGIGNQRSNN